ncbi:putative Kunitz-type serine protease inhibitor isoform X2 [Aquila chrysaetos chrysaetos]|uniref:putative Kunitz-type serine protease inhibitor isoform X2 n=1 Tax=Aquila chrysaetos chrysaetos TaxID=223781 RepID=UPI001B7D32E3|nr:putative Kunitz-type serine protease inhibitor isoform X2 [Aquila chrysaetos chrysaetos]
MPQWWFNITGGSCQSFVFGGCKGNANFLMERECRESCVLGGGKLQRNLSIALSRPKPTPPTMVTGPCCASFLRWYYSPANRTCQRFIYGGCQGNKNNYQHEEECLKRCSPKPEDTGGTGANFRGDFLSTKALALGVLLAVLAAVLLGYMMDITLKTCRRKPELPGVGTGWSPGNDKEYLMSNAYTL